MNANEISKKYRNQERDRRRGGDIEAMILSMWRGMLSRTRNYEHFIKLYRDIELKMTREQFREFALSKPELVELIKVWVASGWKQALVPSVDRINSAGHYEMSNIRFVTMAQNSRFGQLKRHAKRTKCNRGHEYTPENAIPYISRGSKARRCRACEKINHRDYWRKNHPLPLTHHN